MRKQQIAIFPVSRALTKLNSANLWTAQTGDIRFNIPHPYFIFSRIIHNLIELKTCVQLPNRTANSLRHFRMRERSRTTCTGSRLTDHGFLNRHTCLWLLRTRGGTEKSFLQHWNEKFIGIFFQLKTSATPCNVCNVPQKNIFCNTLTKNSSVFFPS